MGAMTSNGKMIRRFLIVFCIYGIAIGAYLWVSALQPLPEQYRGTAVDPSTFLPQTGYQAMKEYTALRNWLFFLSYPWEWGVYLFLLLGGAAKRWSVKYPLPLFVLFVSLAAYALQLPLRLVSYALSRGYGISTQTVPSWGRDVAISFAIDYITMLAVVWTVFYLLSKLKRWWAALWLLSIPFIVFMLYVQPVVIDPLYNRFEPLSDPSLEHHILELADRAGVPADRVYEVNMSEKTNSLNAYVTGIGPSLRIVLWDTTLERLEEREILFIMAHEIGHYVMHHLEWSVVGSIGSALAFLWIGSRLYAFAIARFGGVLGIRKANDRSALPLMLLLLSVLTFASLPLSNAVSRASESAADRYALELMGSAEGAVSMYQKLAVSSLSDLDPPLLVRWFRYTHPSIQERILAVQEAEGK
jgi:STE24 endopeptidase